MIEIEIEMPKSAGMSGFQKVCLPAVPRVGEVIRDKNDRYYKVIGVAYRPWKKHSEEAPVEVTVESQYATSLMACVEGREHFGEK